jgi:hypothetical protein
VEEEAAREAAEGRGEPSVAAGDEEEKVVLEKKLRRTLFTFPWITFAICNKNMRLSKGNNAKIHIIQCKFTSEF